MHMLGTGNDCGTQALEFYSLKRKVKRILSDVIVTSTDLCFRCANFNALRADLKNKSRKRISTTVSTISSVPLAGQGTQFGPAAP